MVEKDIVTNAMTQQFYDPEEYVMVSDRVKRIKVQGVDTANRIYIMTTDSIYLFNDGKSERKYKIKDVGAIFVSSQNNVDFVLFFEKSDDLPLSSSSRNEILALLKLRFNCINRNITLRCYSLNT